MGGRCDNFNSPNTLTAFLELSKMLSIVVGSGELVEKPIGLINLSASSTFAKASLVEILTVMSAKIVPQACLSLTLPWRSMTMEEMLSEAEIVERLKEALGVWRQALGIEAFGVY